MPRRVGGCADFIVASEAAPEWLIALVRQDDLLATAGAADDTATLAAVMTPLDHIELNPLAMLTSGSSIIGYPYSGVGVSCSLATLSTV